ncbi:MAG: HAD family hydrolase [Treponema sp.]|nr:HAD family hydrolase [Treponema sp.]
MKTDGIILDIDGTIWNTTEVVAQAWNKAIEEVCPQIPRVSAQILQGQFGKPMNVIADNLFKGISLQEREALLEACCKLEQIAVAENTKDITYPTVVQTIKEIAKSHKLFIVSNCHDGYIELTMDKNNIRPYISDWECYGHNGKAKDQNISLLVNRNNLQEPVYVGDTEGDLLACEKAGLPFIWAAYGFGKNIPESRVSGIINTFAELKKLLD